MSPKKLVLEFVQHSEIEGLETEEKIKKILSIVKENKIIILEGRFKRQEEVQLIQKTMESIDGKFKGIEIAVINPNSDVSGFLKKLRVVLANILLGEREGITLIGPATVIHEIKQDPTRLNQLSIDLNN